MKLGTWIEWDIHLDVKHQQKYIYIYIIYIYIYVYVYYYYQNGSTRGLLGKVLPKSLRHGIVTRISSAIQIGASDISTGKQGSCCRIHQQTNFSI